MSGRRWATTTKLFPNAMLHWEDFGVTHARRILNKYADQVCTFNDDMQGGGCAGRRVRGSAGRGQAGCATSGWSFTALVRPGSVSRT
jgi:hypothetical protein